MCHRGAAGRHRRGRGPVSRPAGFVLLEVLIATAIMTGGILVALTALRSAARLADVAEQRQRAIYLLERQLVEVEEAASLAAGVRAGQFPAPSEDFAYRVTVAAVGQQADGAGTLWLVEAEVLYPSHPDPRTVEASRYIWKPEPES